MINVYNLKKWVAFLLCGLFSVITFFIGITFYGFWIGLLSMAIMLLLMTLLGFALIKNPFSTILEGKGILALDMNSTGIITPFVVGLRNPDIIGNIKGRPVKDVFDRAGVFDLAAPVKNVTTKDGKGARPGLAEPVKINPDGSVTFTLNKEGYNKARFAFLQYPTLIFNSHLNSFVTKEFFSDKEKQSFAEHTVLYLNRNMQELTGLIRDFTRHVVDQLKPKPQIWTSKIFWIILIIGIIILAVLFLPSVIKTVSGGFSTATGSIPNPTNIVRPG